MKEKLVVAAALGEKTLNRRMLRRLKGVPDSTERLDLVAGLASTTLLLEGGGGVLDEVRTARRRPFLALEAGSATHHWCGAGGGDLLAELVSDGGEASLVGVGSDSRKGSTTRTLTTRLNVDLLVLLEVVPAELTGRRRMVDGFSDGELLDDISASEVGTATELEESARDSSLLYLRFEEL
jgi:hypothetical protein